jgi:hypothetical protein
MPMRENRFIYRMRSAKSTAHVNFAKVHAPRTGALFLLIGAISFRYAL